MSSSDIKVHNLDLMDFHNHGTAKRHAVILRIPARNRWLRALWFRATHAVRTSGAVFVMPYQLQPIPLGGGT